MGALIFYTLQALWWVALFALVGLGGYALYNVGIAAMTNNSHREEVRAKALKYVGIAKKFGFYAPVALVAMMLIGTLSSAFVNVPAGHRGVIFSASSGVSQRILTEGLQMVTPILESVKLFDVRQKTYDLNAGAGTKDTQTVTLKLAILFTPDAGRINEIYQKYGESYEQALLPNQVLEVLKSEVAKYSAIELLPKRAAIANDVQEALSKRMAPYGIHIADVTMGDVDFSEAFDTAIEEKQIAEQTALKKQYELQAAQKQAEIVRAQAQGEAEAAIAKAEGQARAAKIVAAAIQGNPNYMELERMKNREAIAKALADGKNVVYLPSNTVFTMPAPGGK